VDFTRAASMATNLDRFDKGAGTAFRGPISGAPGSHLRRPTRRLRRTNRAREEAKEDFLFGLAGSFVYLSKEI